MNRSPLKVIAGMPAFNEEKYIGSLILQIRQYVDSVIVVDDGSTDRTSQVAELAGAVTIRHEENRGYGAAIRSIIAAAKKHDADILVILDADSQHDPAEIPVLMAAVSGGADVVIGSREMQENKIAPYRRFGQKVLARLTGIASGKKLSDTESGFRAYSKRAINTLELKEEGMAVSSEIVSEAAGKGLVISEVPISVTYTGDGSTLNPVRHGLGVFNRIMVMISERKPLLFFGIFGGLFVILGIIESVVVIRLYYFGSTIFAVGNALLAILFLTIGMLTVFTGVILNVLVKRLDKML